MKAEMLSRESLRIRTLLYGNNHKVFGPCCSFLAFILMRKGNLVHETMELFKRTIAVDTHNFGPDGDNTESSNSNLCAFYSQLANVEKNS